MKGWYLTFSHDKNSWMAWGGWAWVPVPPEMARDALDRGYTLLDLV